MWKMEIISRVQILANVVCINLQYIEIVRQTMPFSFDREIILEGCHVVDTSITAVVTAIHVGLQQLLWIMVSVN